MNKPPMFSDLKLADARTAATGKWLLIDFTAEWCGPCKHMDQTTWVDPAVVAWVKERAVAVQIDVDHDVTAKEFSIKAMPTVVALRNDAEVDRIVGARSPAQLLEWLDGLEHGKTDLDRLREASGTDPMARMKLADTLLHRGATDEAMEHFVWAWENALRVDSAFAGMRHSFLARGMQQAADASTAARQRAVALRDAALRGSSDWQRLNDVLRDPAKTLAWFDEARAAGQPVELSPGLEELLIRQGRWRDLGELLRAPLIELQEHFAQLDYQPKDLPVEHLASMREAFRRIIRTKVSTLVRALHAANRQDEARAVADEARGRDPSPEMLAALKAAE